MYCLTVLEARSLKSTCYKGLFLLGLEGAVPGLSLWLVGGHLLPVSLHVIFPLCMSVSKFPLFIRILVILD